MDSDCSRCKQLKGSTCCGAADLGEEDHRHGLDRNSEVGFERAGPVPYHFGIVFEEELAQVGDNCRGP
jgi:hypothetical protein